MKQVPVGAVSKKGTVTTKKKDESSDDSDSDDSSSSDDDVSAIVNKFYLKWVYLSFLFLNSK